MDENKDENEKIEIKKSKEPDKDPMRNLVHIEAPKKKETPSDIAEKSLQAKLAQEHLLLGQDLSSEERDVIDCFEKPRMMLQRIFIIYNQTRQQMGVSLLNEEEIHEILGKLAEKEYITIEKFTYQNKEREAFLLTEKGKQMLE